MRVLVLLAGVSLLGAACRGPGTTPAPSPAPPRVVVLVTIDTLRYDHVGAKRDGVALTPELDRFAKDAVVYSDSIANASETVPTHASLLTGLYPFRHRATSNRVALPREVPTLAATLRDHGFATGAVISSRPLENARLRRGFTSFDKDFDGRDPNRDQELFKTPAKTTRDALAFVEQHARESFFLWVHYFPPHGPYRPDAPFLEGLPERYSGSRLPISTGNFEKGTIPAYQRFGSEADPEAFRRRYAGNVREADHYVGLFLDGLRRLGLYDGATIVVTADHGESLGEHGWYFLHSNLVYEEQVRVPLLLKRAGARDAGRVVARPVESVDVTPTLLQELDLPALPGVDGRVILPETLSDAAHPRVSQSHDGELRAAFAGPWKLILRFPHVDSFVEKGYPERALFDLRQDPGETRDRSREAPPVLASLETLLREHSAAAGPAGEPSEPENAEALRALGYSH